MSSLIERLRAATHNTMHPTMCEAADRIAELESQLATRNIEVVKMKKQLVRLGKLLKPA